MIDAQVKEIPKEHTTAILRSDGSVYDSGSLDEMKHKWNSLPFDAISDIFTFAVHAIDGKWYRTSWQQF